MRRKFQYCTLRWYSAGRDQDYHLEQSLEKLGNEGWELAATSVDGDVVLFHFKREAADAA